MIENQTDRLQELEDVMAELQSMRSGSQIKSVVVVQSEDPPTSSAPTAAATKSRSNGRVLIGIGALAVCIVGLLVARVMTGDRGKPRLTGDYHDYLSDLGAPTDMTRLAQIQAAATRAKSGDPAAALRDIESITDTDCTPDELLTAAAVFAGASTQTTNDPALAEHRAARAVLFLRRAVLQGYTDANGLQANRDLAALQGRKDFRRLVGELNTPRR